MSLQTLKFDLYVQNIQNVVSYNPSLDYSCFVIVANIFFLILHCNNLQMMLASLDFSMLHAIF